MSNYYNLDGVKTELKKRIDAASAKLEAWQAVTFPTKKDGAPFASMAKNIDGAKYNKPAHSLRTGEYELTIYAHSNLNGYISDYIYCYPLNYVFLRLRSKKSERFFQSVSFDIIHYDKESSVLFNNIHYTGKIGM